jgi:hypothetical protein
MHKTQIDRIMRLNNEMGELIKEIAPETAAEWDAMEKITAAHKQLRNIDIMSISQQKMDI